MKINFLLILLASLYSAQKVKVARVNSIPENSGEYYTESIIPPSPASYAMATYGNKNVNDMFTGRINTNISLPEYQVANINIPISMGYSSAGIKIDQLDNPVGNTWVLNVGGVISKTIYSADDEVTPVDAPSDFQGIMTSELLNYLHDKTKYGGLTNMEYDEFNFSFQGKSGKFILSKDLQIIKITPSDLKIERLTDSVTNLTYFLITDESGTQYTFKDREKTRYYPSTCEKLSTMAPNTNLQTTAWYLSSIKTVNNNEVFFSYEDAIYSYFINNSQQMKQVVSTSELACGTEGTSGFFPPNYALIKTCSARQTNYVKNLKKIYTNDPNQGFVVFNYTSSPYLSGFKYLTDIQYFRQNESLKNEQINFIYTTTNTRKFLKNLKFDKSGQNYNFEYLSPETLPDRLSYSQDFWGYYNGATNTNLIPNTGSFTQGANRDANPEYSARGLLTKILYPTGGSTRMEYEQNSYDGFRKQVNILSKDQEDIDLTKASVSNSSNFTYTKEINSGDLDPETPVSLEALIGFYDESICPPFYDPNDPVKSDLSVTISLYDMSDNTKVNISAPNSPPDLKDLILRVNSQSSNLSTFQLLKNKNYKLVITSPKCITTNYSLTIFGATYNRANIPTGGVRVRKRINNSGTQSDVIRYYIVTPKVWTVKTDI